MGEIVDLANTAFADYNTPGVPASGAKQPQKSAIRGIFSAVEAAVEAAGTELELGDLTPSQIRVLAGLTNGTANDLVLPGLRLPQTLFEFHATDTHTSGAQNINCFSVELPASSAARVKIAVEGNVNNVDVGLAEREFLLLRSTGNVIVSALTPSTWSLGAGGTGSATPVSGFFTISHSILGRIVFFTVTFTPSASGSELWATMSVARARLDGSLTVRARKIIPAVINRSQFLSTASSIAFIPGVGQSNSIGYNSQTVVTPNCLDPGRAGMFNAGFRFLNSDQSSAAEAVQTEEISAIIDAEEQVEEESATAQTVCSTLMNRYLGRNVSSVGAMMALSGIGGQAYATLKSGQTPFSNLASAAAFANLVLRTTELRTIFTPFVYYDHSESQQADSEASYKANLVEWQSTVKAALNSAFSRSDAAPFLMSQTSNNGINGPNLAQMSVCFDNPTKFILAGPKYFLTYTDGTHLDAASIALLGYYLDRAHEWWLAGTQFPFMYLTSVVVTGTSGVATVSLPNGGQLVLDTTLVTNPGSGWPTGLRFTDDGGTAAISGTPTVLGANQIAFTLNAAPSGANPRLEVAGNTGGSAGPTTGSRACWRDNNSDTVNIPGTGVKPMYNWLCHQRKTATVIP